MVKTCMDRNIRQKSEDLSSLCRASDFALRATPGQVAAAGRRQRSEDGLRVVGCVLGDVRYGLRVSHDVPYA